MTPSSPPVSPARQNPEPPEQLDIYCNHNQRAAFRVSESKNNPGRWYYCCRAVESDTKDVFPRVGRYALWPWRTRNGLDSALAQSYHEHPRPLPLISPPRARHAHTPTRRSPPTLVLRSYRRTRHDRPRPRRAARRDVVDASAVPCPSFTPPFTPSAPRTQPSQPSSTPSASHISPDSRPHVQFLTRLSSTVAQAHKTDIDTLIGHLQRQDRRLGAASKQIEFQKQRISQLTDELGRLKEGAASVGRSAGQAALPAERLDASETRLARLESEVAALKAARR